MAPVPHSPVIDATATLFDDLTQLPVSLVPFRPFFSGLALGSAWDQVVYCVLVLLNWYYMDLHGSRKRRIFSDSATLNQ